LGECNCFLGQNACNVCMSTHTHTHTRTRARARVYIYTHILSFPRFLKLQSSLPFYLLCHVRSWVNAKKASETFRPRTRFPSPPPLPFARIKEIPKDNGKGVVSLFLLFSLSLSLSLTHFLHLSHLPLPLSLPASVPLCVCLCFFLSLSLSVCLFDSLSVRLAIADISQSVSILISFSSCPLSYCVSISETLMLKTKSCNRSKSRTSITFQSMELP